VPEELMRELTQLQNYAAGFQTLLSSAQAAAPARSEGKDGTGTVSVSLGSDGLPQSFRVEQGWHSRITPESFGHAVLEAFQAAMGERLAMWTRTLDERGWREEVDELRADSPSRLSVPTTGQIPPAFRCPEPAPNPRSIEVVAEEMIKAFDNVRDVSPSRPQAATGTGADRSGKLTLTLSRTGLVSCTADARWVADQTAARLMTSLGEALAAARAELAQRGDQAAPSSGLHELFAEAFALLNDPQHVTGS
jgi:hypothetical protein